jgi:hypothetical protein
VTIKPSYVLHTVDESDVTIDWFFGKGHRRTKLAQLALIVVGWFFAVLPVVITASALAHRHDPEKGWWGYHEGFVMWDVTVATLGILTGFFLIGFFVLFVVDRIARRGRDRRKTYDEERLAQRLEVATTWYAEKFGPESLRLQQKRVEIESFGDVETYELRGLYRTYGLD